jgi:tRNA1Val (adenine37-N6)-methyltransferase
MGSIFRFKRFEVDQTGCAMKINTDGVLLGAIADYDQPAAILDIGTGTGVIALMLAQRFSGAAIDAVEIDESAASAASRNFLNAPFPDRVRIYHTAIKDYQTSNRYDLIVSNPPFFVNDLKSMERRKEIARHTHEDFFDLLLLKAGALMSKTGMLWLVLPVKQAEKVIRHAVLRQLFPVKIINIHSDRDKIAFRQIICLGFMPQMPVVHEHFYIYRQEGVYTDEYKYLLRDFFLAF